MNKYLKATQAFLRPTKRKIVIWIMIFILLLINSFFTGGMGFCRQGPCPNDEPRHYRPYYDCGRCVEPTLKEDIIEYSKLYSFGFFFGSTRLPSEFLLLTMLLWYIIVCLYVRSVPIKNKERFLTPTKLKIALSFIFIIFLIASMGVGIDLFWILFVLHDLFPDLFDPLLSFVPFLLVFIEIYLFSCLIVFLYNKFMKNKKVFRDLLILIILLSILLALSFNSYKKELAKEEGITYVNISDLLEEYNQKEENTPKEINCECSRVEVPACQWWQKLITENYTIQECNLTCRRPICLDCPCPEEDQRDCGSGFRLIFVEEQMNPEPCEPCLVSACIKDEE